MHPVFAGGEDVAHRIVSGDVRIDGGVDRGIEMFLAFKLADFEVLSVRAPTADPHLDH